MSRLDKVFADLHKGTPILNLPNAWDAGSARIFEAQGAKAIATTSAGAFVEKGESGPMAADYMAHSELQSLFAERK
jgi:2-methylisocitrate lyase-like PEP mutase family enzyme